MVWVGNSSDLMGQGYFPLAVGNLWEYWEVPGSYWHVEAARDTLMPNGLTYTFLQGEFGGYFRQSGSMVYQFYSFLNDELLRYDFSRTTGDTVAIWYLQGDTIVTTVQSDEVAEYLGRMLRTWVFFEHHSYSSYYASYRVADSLGLTSFQGEVLGYGLRGAIIDGVQYGIITGVENSASQQPIGIVLHQNYPNPFNASTLIRFEIPFNKFVALRVFDLLGREIVVLVNEERVAGTHTVKFNASDLPSGTYFYRLQTEGSVQIKKLVLLR